MKFRNRHPQSSAETGMDRHSNRAPYWQPGRQASTAAVALAIAAAVILVVSIMIGLCASHFPY